MKRLIALILVCALLVGCTPQVDNDGAEPTTSTTETQQTVEYIFTEEGMPEFTGLDDSALLTYMEDSIYTNLIIELDNEMYFVENVSAVYISKEYLEEVAYNSQENIYFGYTLSELDAYFQGTRYVFTLGDDGQTIVTEFQEYDDTYEWPWSTGGQYDFCCISKNRNHYGIVFGIVQRRLRGRSNWHGDWRF